MGYSTISRSNLTPLGDASGDVVVRPSANAIGADTLQELTPGNGVLVDGLKILNAGFSLSGDADLDLYYRKDGALSRLAKGSNGQSTRLKSDGSDYEWFTPEGGLGYTPVPDTRTVNSHPLSSDVIVTKGDVGLSGVVNLDTSNPANISQSSSYRFVSDPEKGVWSGKQDALGFTAVPNTRIVNGYALSGDVSLSKNDIGLNNVENIMLSTWAGTSAITTIGIISSGTVPWANVSKTSSSLADLATKSAGALDSGNLAVAQMPLGGAWSLSSDLNINSDTLVVDQSTKFVGFGTSAPRYFIEVAGSTTAPSIACEGLMIQGLSTTDGQITTNCYYNGGWKYVANASGATSLDLSNGFYFRTFPANAGGAGASATPVDAMTILQDGKVGIGTAAPNTLLHLYNGSVSGTPELRLEGWGSDNAIISFKGAGHNNNAAGIRHINSGNSTGHLAFYANNTDSSTLLERMRITADGNVGIGLTSIDANYIFQCPNDSSKKAKAYAWDTYSDSRIKTNQRELEYGLNEILALTPKRYTHNISIGSSNGWETIGLIAQEVFEIIPEAVNKPNNENELWSMTYEKLIPILVNSIKELKIQIDELKKV